MEDKINFNADNLAFLEKIDDPNVNLQNFDVADQAAQMQVSLDNLEGVDEQAYAQKAEEKPVLESLPIVITESLPRNAKLKKEWANFSFMASDTIIKVFEASDRPFFLIRDDKVIYLNKTALGILEIQHEDDIIGSSFWNYVDKNDWNLLAENIGPMLTEDKEVSVRLKTVKGRVYNVKLHALYMDDDVHFSFVLVGDRKIKYNPGAGLYDAVTGLPNFYLFEDRVQIAVNNEKYKDVRQRKNLMAILGVAIDNMDELKEVNMVDFVLKKLASKLVFRLKKTYTIARGLKYQFWFLINDFNNEHDLEVEIQKIKAIFDEPVAGNYMDYNISTSFGYSIYPTHAKTSNKLIELAIEAIRTAIRYKKTN